MTEKSKRRYLEKRVKRAARRSGLSFTEEELKELAREASARWDRKRKGSAG